MEMMHCKLCDKMTMHKRDFGIGSIVIAILTGGLWLLAWPFYPKRCVVCGQAAD